MMPNLDAGNMAYNLLRVAAGGGITVGPILLGAAKSAHILTQRVTVRGFQHDGSGSGRCCAAGARERVRIAAE
jgi:hypothetical protein